MATRRRRAAASRTCATEPGAEPTSAAYSVWMESITQTSGRSRLERGAHHFEVRLGQDLDALRAAEPRGAELDLGRGLLAGDEQGTALLEIAGQRHQQQRRLPDSRLAADEDERRRDETAAENPVELGDTGRDALGLLGLDVGQAEQRARSS